MGSGYLLVSPLSKKEMEEVIDTLGLSKRNREIIVLTEGLFGKDPVPMKDLCKKFKIAQSTGGAVKKSVFEKMKKIRMKKDILECVRTGRPITGLDKKNA
jgi:translation initiation factor 1 (eIF-1/SUI1)